MFCSSCGKKLTKDSKFCKYCGFDLTTHQNKKELNLKPKKIISKNTKNFSKFSKIFGIVWLFSVLVFFAIAFLADKYPQFSFNNSQISLGILFGSVGIGCLSFLSLITTLSLNLSYGKYPEKSSFKKFLRFILSLIFLPFLIIRNIWTGLFGILVLLPIWGSGFFLVLLIIGVIRFSTPVSGNSMNPTILDKENIKLSSFTFINKFFFRPKKGDIVTFESGRTDDSEGKIVSYIKRIVAVGGDEVSIRDGFLYVNNELIKEPYTAKPRSTFGGSFLADCKSIKIPNGYYFVMGDNRKRSKDSRDIGLISINEIDSILSSSKQIQFKDRLRDASNDGVDHGLPSFNLDDYYQKINKIRKDNNLKELKRNEKLEAAALSRAKSIIENNEVESIGKNEKSKYPYSKAIKDAGYNNITIGEIVTTGYYDADELSSYWLDYETKKNLLNKEFQDTGIASFVGKINDCEVQIIVQEFGGYVPPNYNKSTIEGWEKVLSRLKEIQPSWQKCKDWGKLYEENKTACDRINEILNIRINNIAAAVSRMKSNQWLTSSESRGLDQDEALYNEQDNLATKLNSL